MDNNGKFEIVQRKMTYEEIMQHIEQLNPTEREKLLSELKPGITVIFGGQNLVTHGAAIQINAKDADDVASSLDKIPQDALGEFVKAIGTYTLNGLELKFDYICRFVQLTFRTSKK